jgi:hypothetical protein
MITWTKRLLLTLTSTAFNAALSGLMGTALGVRTVTSMMQSKLISQDKAIKKISISGPQAQGRYPEIRYPAGQQNQSSGGEEYCCYPCGIYSVSRGSRADCGYGI